ncbi:hypothetical protein FRC12_002098 [Ceratobasidium sp. 428]|nr:hypothetical protein FRC12_002098 [Ceratobasidium sp. 428]
MTSPFAQFLAPDRRKRVRISSESPPDLNTGPEIVVLPASFIPAPATPRQPDVGFEKASLLRQKVFDSVSGRLANARPLPTEPIMREVYFLGLKQLLLEGVNLLDAYFLELRPGRKLHCTKHCPASAHFQALEAKTFVSKSIATDTPSPPPAPPCPAPSVSPVTVTVAKTYADVAAGSPSDLPRPASRPSARKGPVAVLQPIRLIIRRADPTDSPHPLAYLFANGSSDPYRRLRIAMAFSPLTKGTPLLGLHRNRKNNAVVSLPHGTPDHVVDGVSDLIKTTLCRTPDSSRSFPLLVTRDVPWAKLMVSSVPARYTQGSPTYSEEEVKQSFLLNPAIQTLKITRAPRWVRNPASITGMHSSFTFSFEDPDGSLARSLAKSHLFVLGEPVHLKRWIDNPLAKRDVSQKTGLYRPALRMPPANGMEE